MRRRDGSTIWVRDRVVPVRDRRGRVRCYEGQLEDVTDEKRHREELEAALRSKIELIGTVSHELRNPLTSIVGYAHLLSEARDHGSPEHAEMAAVVKQQAEDVGRHRRGPADCRPGRRRHSPGGHRPHRPGR